MAVNAIRLDANAVTQATPPQRRAMLRQAVDEMIGTTFYAPMLKMARNSPLKGKYGHGGRGEEIFGAQLDMELARLAATRSGNSLGQAFFERLSQGS